MVAGNEEPENIEGKIEDLIGGDSFFDRFNIESEDTEDTGKDSPESEVG
jgi:hypothetical protein